MIARRSALTFLTVLFGNMVNAQQGSLKLFAEIPVQFGVGYEGRLTKRMSVEASVGLLSPPNSSIIVDVLDVLGTDEQITLIIEDAFKIGVVGTLGCNYNFNRNYAGTFLQIIRLHAGDAPSDLIERYFSTSIDSYPAKKRTTTTEKYLSLSSILWQAGVLYGRRFPLRNKRLEVDAEIGISANISSKSKLTSEERNLSALSEVVDDELAGYYSSYAIVPSISVALVYKLGQRL